MRNYIIAVFCTFGLLFASCLVGVVVYDLYAINHGLITISKDCLILGMEFPVFAVGVTGVACLALGLLLGHLFLGQTK